MIIKRVPGKCQSRSEVIRVSKKITVLRIEFVSNSETQRKVFANVPCVLAKESSKRTVFRIIRTTESLLIKLRQAERNRLDRIYRRRIYACQPACCGDLKTRAKNAARQVTENETPG